MSLNKISRRARQGVLGYALLEALIAVVITSIGFIGAARLQTLGMNYSSGALFRQKATLLANQMTDRMRANSAGLVAGNYNSPNVGDTICLSAGCTPAQLAVADFTEWIGDVATQLPDGQGLVCVDSTPDDGTPAAPACDAAAGGVLAVKVWWSDKSGTYRFVTAARP